MTLKRCLECEQELYGRSDKKFCSDMCRNNYNNRIRSKELQIVRQINCMLLRNRKILSRLLTSQVKKISRSKLMEQGFHFGYCTSTYTTRKGETYLFCYEYGFLELPDGQFCLVRRTD